MGECPTPPKEKQVGSRRGASWGFQALTPLLFCLSFRLSGLSQVGEVVRREGQGWERGEKGGRGQGPD